MQVYAIVGGIGAGKSTVARRLARRPGVARIDADRIGHQVLRGAAVRQRLIATFGPDIVGRDGGIDRRRLGAIVFGAPQRLGRLNAIVHPLLAARVHRRLAALQRRGIRYVLLDAALFFELDLELEVDAVLAVVAPRAVRAERLRRRGNLSDAQIEARLQSQPGLASWTRRADVRLRNDGGRRELEARIEAAWRALLRSRRRGRNRRGADHRPRRAAGSRRSPQGVSLISRT